MHSPIEKFIDWFQQAKNNKLVLEPTAMTLATVGMTGHPSARIVLLKAVDERGFVFYTNLESRKSSEIKHNPHVSLCFHWPALERQVRVEGVIQSVSDEEADGYFATRPRESQIGAWASKQSQDLATRAEFEDAIAAISKRFEGVPVPRPSFWSGWRVVPDRIEFWQQIEFRLHDREVFMREGSSWKAKKLYP